MIKVAAKISEELYKTELTTDTNIIIADEPEAMGGRGAGFSPKELLAASLGSCKAITIKMYANRKGWPLKEAIVTVNFQQNTETNTSYLEAKIELDGDLSEEQKERLFAIAKKCPVHKLLESSMEISTIY